jgi:hypothetical protein
VLTGCVVAASSSPKTSTFAGSARTRGEAGTGNTTAACAPTRSIVKPGTIVSTPSDALTRACSETSEAPSSTPHPHAGALLAPTLTTAIATPAHTRSTREERLRPDHPGAVRLLAGAQILRSAREVTSNLHLPRTASTETTWLEPTRVASVAARQGVPKTFLGVGHHVVLSPVTSRADGRLPCRFGRRGAVSARPHKPPRCRRCSREPSDGSGTNAIVRGGAPPTLLETSAAARAMSWERSRTLATCDRALPARVTGRCWITPVRVTPACRPLRTRGSHAASADLVAACKDEQPPRGRVLRRPSAQTSHTRRATALAHPSSEPRRRGRAVLPLESDSCAPSMESLLA